MNLLFREIHECCLECSKKHVEDICQDQVAAEAILKNIHNTGSVSK